jgi:di/tricarboxylate transporter
VELTADILIVFAVLAVAVVLFISEWLRVDVVAILMVLSLVATGILEPSEAFQGFGSETIIFLAGLFVMSGGLVQTGVVERIAFALRNGLRRRKHLLPQACISTVAAVSAFVSNTVTVSLFVPVVNALSRRGGVTPAAVLMPMAYASMLGGVCTVIGTSTNVVVSGQLERMGHEPYSFFATAKIGLPVLAVGLAYLWFVAPRLLRGRGGVGGADDYAVRNYLGEVVVGPKSAWADKTIRQLRLREQGVEVLGVVRRPDTELREAGPDTRFELDDLVLLKGSSQDILALTSTAGVGTVADKDRERSPETDLRLVEIMVAPGSTLVGHTLKEARFRQRFGAVAIALYRHGAALHQKVGRVRMLVGDVLLVQGSRGATEALTTSPDIIQLEDVSHHRGRSGRAWLALSIFLAFVVGGITTGEFAVCALGGAALMVVTACLTAEEAYDFADWRLLVLIGGMLSVAVAMHDTGAADWLGHEVVAAVGHLGPRFLLATFFVSTVVLTQAMSNQAAALVVLEVALRAAGEAGIAALPMAMTITVAASCAFLTPLEPANVLVYGPGRYRFRDFTRVGLPLTLLVLGITVALVPLIWSL